MIDDDSADALILSPLKQGLVNGCHHARGERMNGFWAVQANAADAAFSGNQDFIGHWRSMSLATIIRMTWLRSEEHTSELQSLMRISYAVFCLKKKKPHITTCLKLSQHIRQPNHQHTQQ